MRLLHTISLVLILSLAAFASAQDEAATTQPDDETPKLDAGLFAGLTFRNIGPALMSGRVGDFAVNPNDHSMYYVAVCSGGVWKTTNAGVTYTPVFDSQGSYSIGCVTMDPNNPNVVWVGTGENNSQRSVSFGNGVYRTRDGGKNWEHLGLDHSEHIGMIAIDPRDSDVVYVAAQGPLWRAGNDRGLYKTTNGGKTWIRVLHVSDDTGVNEVHLDPRDPDIIYASSYQRRRHVWTLVNGGPESAIYKSEDGGTTWRKLTRGLPSVDMGRIGLDISLVNPDVVYAILDAADGESGFFRSTDRGETWEKRCGYKTTSGQYYNEIICDPQDVDRVYSLDTIMQVTEDGGKTFNSAPRQLRHVDDHALWIEPSDTRHMLVGCDGGVYETFDRGENWHYKVNLPVTQFYRVSVDNALPFYNVYGGTQDNNSVGGPSRTTDRIGIANEDWFVTVGGDGYETVVDPEDSNIIYSQWQYGGLVRYDRRSGETVDIKPREKPGDEPFRWNWDSPLIMSPHNRERLYFAANILFRTDDRGNSWRAISGDLTRQIDRNQLPVMGRIQPVDAVDRNGSTSFYGNCVSLCESPVVEDLVYVGTDDGLVQITEDEGANWRRVETFPGVPAMTYVSCLTASQHDADTVFAAFDNHKRGDVKPYLLVSHDRGKTWSAMAGNLPDGEIVYSVQQDHVKPELLFAGTEFGAYFTLDSGEHWHKFKGGLPTIAVRDIDIQRRENDLVLGTFGRSFYVLDDYSPLRLVDEELIQRDAAVLPIKTALRYIESNRLGGRRGRGSQGASFFAADNPPFGAVFTYYLKDKIRSRKELRKEEEKKAEKEGRPAPQPPIEELRAEAEEHAPVVYAVVHDDAGQVVRRVEASREKGLHRVAWNLRYPTTDPVSLRGPGDMPPWWEPPAGPLALPGTYTVTLVKDVDGVVTPLTSPEEFEVEPLALATFAADDKAAVLAFQRKVARLHRAVQGAIRVANETDTRIQFLRKAVIETPDADTELLGELTSVELRLNTLLTELRGDQTRSKYNMPTMPSVSERVSQVLSDQQNVTSPPTQTQQEAYGYAADAFETVLGKLRTLIEQDVAGIEQKLEKAGAPWTPGRVPSWERK